MSLRRPWAALRDAKDLDRAQRGEVRAMVVANTWKRRAEDAEKSLEITRHELDAMLFAQLRRAGPRLSEEPSDELVRLRSENRRMRSTVTTERNLATHREALIAELQARLAEGWR